MTQMPAFLTNDAEIRKKKDIKFQYQNWDWKKELILQVANSKTFETQ